MRRRRVEPPDASGIGKGQYLSVQWRGNLGCKQVPTAAPTEHLQIRAAPAASSLSRRHKPPQGSHSYLSAGAGGASGPRPFVSTGLARSFRPPGERGRPAQVSRPFPRTRREAQSLALGERGCAIAILRDAQRGLRIREQRRQGGREAARFDSTTGRRGRRVRGAAPFPEVAVEVRYPTAISR